MKVRIAESKPGELLERAVDAVRVIERITGQTLLRDDLRIDKSLIITADDKPSGDNQSDYHFAYPVLEESVKRGAKEVERIRKLMLERIDKVLG